MSGNKIGIRRATLADAPKVAYLIQKLWEEVGKEPMSSDMQDSVLAEIMHTAHDPGVVTLLAIVEKRKKEIIAGMVRFDIRSHPYGPVIAWGEHLYVEPEHRGGRVAKLLIQVGEAEAKIAGATEVCVETVIPAMFERMGFKEDRIIMRKPLGGEK